MERRGIVVWISKAEGSQIRFSSSLWFKTLHSQPKENCWSYTGNPVYGSTIAYFFFDSF